MQRAHAKGGRVACAVLPSQKEVVLQGGVGAVAVPQGGAVDGGEHPREERNTGSAFGGLVELLMFATAAKAVAGTGPLVMDTKNRPQSKDRAACTAGNWPRGLLVSWLTKEHLG